MGNNIALNNQMVNSMYNYYDSNIPQKPTTKYDTHKKSELKSLYNNMVASNKRLPLYKITLSENTQDYAINIKNSAINLKNVYNSLTDDDNDIFNSLPDNMKVLEARIGESEA